MSKVLELELDLNLECQDDSVTDGADLPSCLLCNACSTCEHVQVMEVQVAELAERMLLHNNTLEPGKAVCVMAAQTLHMLLSKLVLLFYFDLHVFGFCDKH